MLCGLCGGFMFLQALEGKNYAGRPPVWLMRQAGRYMHEYQALRKRYDFLTLCHTPELICEVTQLPITAFGFDAAILFSDILLIVEALGFRLRFDEEIGPIIENPIEQGQQIQLQDVVPKMDFVLQGILLAKKSLSVPLIGFAGAPFTVASYLIEGKSSRDLRKTKKWLLEDPKSFSQIIDTLTDATIKYLNAQIEAGCDALQLFDSWAMYLGFEQFEQFVAKPIERILKSLKKCPVIVFSRSSASFATALQKLGATAISLDWQCDIKEMRKKLPDTCLQGNLDPDILLTNPQTVVKETRTLLDKMKNDPAFVCNLGHGVLKETARENVEALVACVKSYG